MEYTALVCRTLVMVLVLGVVLYSVGRVHATEHSISEWRANRQWSIAIGYYAVRASVLY